MVARIHTLARLIIVQFNSTNSNLFPSWLRFNPEAPKKPGQDVPSGELIAGPAENISVAEFIDQINDLGYEMMDAFRRNVQNQDKRYHIAYFLFAPHQYAVLSEEFKKIRGNAFIELRKLTKESMWMMKGYNNPFFADGVEVAGERALVINCQARKPLLENNQPIMVWSEGCSKERPGKGKVPLQPKDHLKIEIISEATSAAA